MTTKTTLILGAAIALVTVGCGAGAQLGHLPQSRAVRVVRRGDVSGELALLPTLSAHYAAEDAMLAHCGGRVRFVSPAESSELAIADPSDPTKADDPTSIPPDAERVYYVCVTRQERAQRAAR